VSLVSRTWFTPRDVAGELVLSIGVAESARASGVHGTLSDDDGAPMRRAVLVAAAHDDPSALRIPVAAENGAFDSDLVPPGVHQWIAVGARGAVDLGTHTSVAGESLDLGDYRAGATGTLVLRWLTPPPRNEEWSLRWSVQVGAREEKGKVCDLAPPELALPLYPGKYQIDVSSADGSLRCAYTLWITARETLSIEVP
jgi:hypothetical protein